MKIRYLTADGFEIEEETSDQSPRYEIVRALYYPLSTISEWAPRSEEKAFFRSRVYEYRKRDGDVFVYQEKFSGL